MTQRSSPVETSLLYPTKSAPIDRIDTCALRSLFTMLDLTAGDIRKQNQDYILIDCGPIEVVIVACNTPFPKDHFEGADYPARDTKDGLRIGMELGRYASSLTVVVVDKTDLPDHVPDLVANQRIGWHLAFLLMEMTGPELVFWCEDDRLMTPEMVTDAVKDFHRAHPFTVDKNAALYAAVDQAVHDGPVNRVVIPTQMQFAQEPVLSSDVLEWFHRPKAGEQSDVTAEDEAAKAALPGLGNWLRRMSHISRATMGLSFLTINIGLFGLPYKASAALGKLF